MFTLRLWKRFRTIWIRKFKEMVTMGMQPQTQAGVCISSVYPHHVPLAEISTHRRTCFWYIKPFNEDSDSMFITFHLFVQSCCVARSCDEPWRITPGPYIMSKFAVFWDFTTHHHPIASEQRRIYILSPKCAADL